MSIKINGACNYCCTEKQHTIEQHDAELARFEFVLEPMDYTEILEDMKPEGVIARVEEAIQEHGEAFEFDHDCHYCSHGNDHSAFQHYKELIELDDAIFRRRHGLNID